MPTADPIRDDVARLQAVVIAGRVPSAVLDGRWLTLHTSSGCWILDLHESSLCRADCETDPHFVASEHWQHFAEVRIDDGSIRVVLDSGVTVSSPIQQRSVA